MRQSIHKTSHNNLAASKRSIVIAVAGLALIMGTTSVGTSLFLDKQSQTADSSANPLETDNAKEREIPFGWPAFTILQGKAITVPSAPVPSTATPTTPTSPKKETAPKPNSEAATIIVEDKASTAQPSHTTNPEPTPAGTPNPETPAPEPTTDPETLPDDEQEAGEDTDPSPSNTDETY